MAKKKESAVSIAERLLEIRQQINDLKLPEKALSIELRKRIESGESQSLFYINEVPTIKVVDAETARTWALETAPQLLVLNMPATKKWFQTYVANEKPETHGMKWDMTSQLRQVGEKDE